VTIEELQQYLEECFEKQTVPRVSELALRAGVSPSAICKNFRSSYGSNPARIVKLLQVSRAARLLADTTTPIALVAKLAGFTTRESFFRTFKTLTGITPRTFRLRNLGLGKK